ncbi:MAG: SusD/RagB family nutrient-binding outer membrane lipoprotein [Chitinophaga sp.]|uniref:RagB/SusD family nutrient uptake outer membrane protein n=1 Tax=Chitinophaga sp. TaxID=1869181 RepID=UPI001B06B639|nr:RagB/SusD family nutrient uptake outer membrane protein [Chitinophaga sp.]MBO9733171.1 SusD/RagB family nutrient-binding outer membrane lipoprotein [Chitinophaga sp.]
MKFQYKLQGYTSRLWIAVAVLVTGLSACTKNFERYNTNNTGVTDAQLGADFIALGAYLKSAQMAIYNFSGGGDPNSFQVQQNLNADCFSGYFMSPNPFGGNTNMNYGLVSGWNGEAYKVGYLSVMLPVAKLRRTGIEKTYPAIWAVAQIVQVTGMSRVTDIYGPVPYSHAGEVSPGGVPYDSQQDIYKRFFLELDSATKALRTQISSGTTLPFDFGSFDAVYAGNFPQWLRFANSLRLRLATRINNVDKALSKSEGEKALDPANGGVLTDNADNMTVKVTGNFTNPLVFIAKNWADTRICATLQCFLTGFKDPRISKYMDKSTDPSFPAQYIGIRSGSITGADSKDGHSGYSSLNTDNGPAPSFALNTPVQLMTAAEVYFLRAEAALNGWANAGGTAQQLYEQGVTTSMAQWKVDPAGYLNDNTSVPAPSIDPKAKDTLANPSKITIKWNDAASPEVKLERIITQKWLAMFPEGQEAWSEFRRTGYPKLFPVLHNNSGNVISSSLQVRRLPYPQDEYSTSATAVANGIKLLGGNDTGGTPLWWDTRK